MSIIQELLTRRIMKLNSRNLFHNEAIHDYKEERKLYYRILLNIFADRIK
jgi:hypothetical protein